MVSKLKRTFTSVLPVSEKRRGTCVHCGECCKLPFTCPMLIEKPGGEHYCSIYSLRFLNCRKYPRAKSEFITRGTCGYKFVESD